MGCGWGSLTVHAARDHRARVTAVTLSAEQGGYVRQRVRGLGLVGRAEVRIQDYRDPLDGASYDAVASIEMGEHVGAAQYPRFCSALHHLLRPGGRLLIQQMSRGGRAPGRRSVHRVLHRARHAHAPGGGDGRADRERWV